MQQLHVVWLHTFINESSVSGNEVTVPDTVVQELAKLSCTFANLRCDYRKKIQSSPEAEEKCTNFLPELLPTRPHREFTPLFDEFINVKVCIFNIHYLKLLSDEFSEDIR